MPTAKFCSECGTTLTPTGQPTVTTVAQTAAPGPTPVASATTELRHVSVLFCDLVGFTPLSESLDPEEVRELLSGYFELARAIIARYGGVIQKFIGDAVMAVWGARAANEDDAERAVRAGLDLVAAVRTYGSGGSSALSCRVGVVTGEVATTETQDEGLVIGDRVNTAARIQSVASPGCVFVDEATWQATSAAISYTDRGEQELKGKSTPTRVFEATRVVGTVAGAERTSGIEAPFVGRDRELLLVKELFHSCEERRLARLVLVSGVAGIGKSRLSWEFFKYIDGLAGSVLWHSGRCLAYGEGVSYWALSEMVRSRLQIGEDDPAEVVSERLRAGLERWIEDPADREFIAPRLGQLLGLSSERQLPREELFSGWRLFFERLSEHLPVVMVIEDLQWADPGVLDFLDYLLEWSADHGLFVLVLSRPEGTEQRGLRLSRRNVTTLTLDPLDDAAMGELLDGIVTGLSEKARASIVERAEGIPLYAVETVRALADKGRLIRQGDGLYRLLGELGQLDIPPGLTALIASRLDALSELERQLVKDCTVLGQSFSSEAATAVSGYNQGELEELLASLVRKEVLAVRADRLSPERGQYVFTQSLIRSVAYGTLSRHDRKSRHLAAASYLRSAFPGDGAEVAEVIASHLHEAYEAAGTDGDADDLRAAARMGYLRAAERAEAVGAPEVTESAYLTAASLADEEGERTRLIELAGDAAFAGGWYDRALARYGESVAAHSAAGRTVESSRVAASLGRALIHAGRSEEAVVRLREALARLDDSAPPAVLSRLHNNLGAALVFAGHVDEARAPFESALILSQHHGLEDELYRALANEGTRLAAAGRDVEALLHYEASLAFARRVGLVDRQATGLMNLGSVCMTGDLPGAEAYCLEALALSRNIGDRGRESLAAANLIYVLQMTGRFEEARRLGRELFDRGGDDRPRGILLRFRLGQLEVISGDLATAEAHLGAISDLASSQDAAERTSYHALKAAVALARGEFAEAVEAAMNVLGEAGVSLSVSDESVRDVFPVAVEASLALEDLEGAEAVIRVIADRPQGQIPPFLKAQIARGRALLAAARGVDDGIASDLLAAEEIFRRFDYSYWVARTELERAEQLARTGDLEEARQLASTAAETFSRLGVAPLLVRCDAMARVGAPRT